MQTPITLEGMFWERTGDDLCPVCAQHRIVILQKIGQYYALHTRVATNVNIARCIHVWRTRKEDPYCLASFTPTGKIPVAATNDDNLSLLLANARVGIDHPRADIDHPPMLDIDRVVRRLHRQPVQFNP